MSLPLVSNLFYICFKIIILEFLQHDDWGQIDQIFSASYLGKHCKMLKIDIYPSYVPELILKTYFQPLAEHFSENSIKSSFFSAPPQFCEQFICFFFIDIDQLYFRKLKQRQISFFSSSWKYRETDLRMLTNHQQAG